MTVSECLFELSRMPGFKMYKEHDRIFVPNGAKSEKDYQITPGKLLIEVDDIQFNATGYYMEEAIFKAFIFFVEKLARKAVIDEMKKAIPKV